MGGRVSEGTQAIDRVERAVAETLAGRRVVLAVSGGRDSIALLHAAARAARSSIACVATFDHGTGAAARDAVRLVAAESRSLGLPVTRGRRTGGGDRQTEAAWRARRLRFLTEVAREHAAQVATAHTRDDQLETVVMRVLRAAGARGLAGLFAESAGFVRPMLAVTRADVTAYVHDMGVPFVDDPFNADTRFLRNRVRRDLIPALLRRAPQLDRELLDIARDAADWRARVDRLALTLSEVREPGRVGASVVLSRFEHAALAILWPAIAARVGLAMDWRGTERAAAFTTSATPGKRMQLSGGWEIRRTREQFELYLSL
ncbi:MAG TPA: tRNA lysidine(34) synthetase TilS [Gemmatimonadaceae bacterium]|nr:tRNA lysidine(34) synthetase TilS [Gemmatimonadaceae bacterium]